MRLPILALTLAALALSDVAAARTCELTITGNDRIQFDQPELVVESDCTEVTLTLKHVGTLPVEQMGHNWVLTATEAWQAVAQASISAGPDHGYLPADDEHIIAHTDMIGGGESTSVTFKVDALESGSDYTFFCSFPGHAMLMNGTLIVR